VAGKVATRVDERLFAYPKRYEKYI
jgi:hypothetical protein